MKHKTKFKQTEIGLIPEDWEKSVFSNKVEINPRRELKKGAIAKFVSMADIEPFQRKISKHITREYKGGSKFRNGDTLFARITPCLENGKTAFVDILDDGEMGFGSTEFIVLSGREGETDSKYVYYLSRSPDVRNAAIQAMTGTSGRQRVEGDVFNQIILNFPSIDEQQSIASILSSLDEKIELNQQMNKTLEKIGQAIFKHWFIDFEFPDEKGKPYKSRGGEMMDSELGEIPKGWEVGNFGQIVEITSGKRPNEKSGKATSDYSIPLIGASSTMGFVKESLYDEPIIVIGRVGTHGIVQRVMHPSFPSDNTLVIKSKYYGFIYQVLRMIDYESLNVGTTQPLITQSSIKNHKIIIPEESLLIKYEDFIFPIFIIIEENVTEIEKLSRIRDSLLPKLMSGKIRVNMEAS